MPALTAQTVQNTIASELTFTALDGATDTFTLSNIKQLLILRNDTGADVTITMLGDGAPATHECRDFGQSTTDPLSVTVAANAYFTQYLNGWSGTLKGETTITNGVGLSAAIINL